jgi:hypothetical protein
MLNTSRKTLWIVAVLLIITAVAEQLILPNILGLNRVIYHSASIVYLFVVSMIVGLTSAIFPFKGRNYVQRLEPAVLLSFIVCSFMMDITFGSLMFKKNKDLFHIGKRRDYKEAKIAVEGSCKDLQDGTFEDENLIIIRNGNKQIQTYKKSHKRDIMQVRWISECEYEIIPESNLKGVIMVKITMVTNEGYSCIASSDGGEVGREYTYKRIE